MLEWIFLKVTLFTWSIVLFSSFRFRAVTPFEALPGGKQHRHNPLFARIAYGSNSQQQIISARARNSAGISARSLLSSSLSENNEDAVSDSNEESSSQQQEAVSQEQQEEQHQQNEETKEVAEETTDDRPTKENWDERFDYKLRALIGMYDPADGDTDNERQDGNILNAMIKFPAMHSFNVVGKTNGEELVRERFVEEVRQVVSQNVLGTSSDHDNEANNNNGSTSLNDDDDNDDDVVDDDDRIKISVTPRGKKFTKISIETMVGSSSMVNAIYDDLGEIEGTVMRF